MIIAVLSFLAAACAGLVLTSVAFLLAAAIGSYSSSDELAPVSPIFAYTAAAILVFAQAGLWFWLGSVA